MTISSVLAGNQVVSGAAVSVGSIAVQSGDLVIAWTYIRLGAPPDTVTMSSTATGAPAWTKRGATVAHGSNQMTCHTMSPTESETISVTATPAAGGFTIDLVIARIRSTAGAMSFISVVSDDYADSLISAGAVTTTAQQIAIAGISDYSGSTAYSSSGTMVSAPAPGGSGMIRSFERIGAGTSTEDFTPNGSAAVLLLVIAEEPAGGGGGGSNDEGRGVARGVGRGVCRGMHRRITDWLRLPSGVLIPA